MPTTDSDHHPQAPCLASSPSMSAASVSRTSPLSSPLSNGRRGRYSARPSPTQASTAARSQTQGQAQTPRPAMSRQSNSHEQAEPSPNYFNLTIDSSKSCQSSGGGVHARSNFSPPSSRVRSTAAVSPSIVPLDQNPDYEAFRRQSDLRNFRSNLSFSLPDPVEISGATAAAPAVRLPSPNASNVSQSSVPRPLSGALETFLAEDKPRSPKRSLPSPYTNFTDRPRRRSPAEFNDREIADAPPLLRHLMEETTHSSLPTTTFHTSPPGFSLRSETLPSALNGQVTDSKDNTPFSSPSHIATLLEGFEDQILLLDLRVSTQYARSRIEGALNLCIPTTLLKRPSYDTRKLAATFKNAEQRSKFERWRSCKYIVVYDGSASRPKDALTCVNMLTKFNAEGWSGSSHIIRGGFEDFMKQFPNFVHYDAGSSSGTDSESPTGIAPVIGGCPMPATQSAANPFFGNIRQNMDLIGGVGQIPLKLPRSMSNVRLEEMPRWLSLAADAKDEGKLVSDKFLSIEKEEQKRMQEALSEKVIYGESNSDVENIKIAGIEKGNKNRYNNIWPYEHSRVKLQGIHEGGCDYVNANFVKTAWSHKRYIATQGPIPATFTDFWKVVWQQDVRVIVMLTAETESGQVKAHNYWSQKRFGPLHLTFLSENKASLEQAKIHRHRERPPMGRRRLTNPATGRNSSPKDEGTDSSSSSAQPYVIVRRFMLSNDEEPFARMREITHLQYSDWPDFGAPAHPAHLLGLVEQTDAVVRGAHAGSSSGPAPEDSRPLLVHCSAGCGRTGTFCTVDSVIDILKRQIAAKPQIAKFRQKSPVDIEMKSPQSTFSSISQEQNSDLDESTWVNREEIDLIEKVVRDFRLQRLSMVQSLRQYVLCYESVMEWLAERTPRSA